MSEQEPNPFAVPGSAARPVGSEPAGVYASHGPAPVPGSYAPAPPPPNVSAIVLLVLSTLAVLPTFLLATPAFVVSIVALTRNRDAPASSRRLALIGWGLLAFALLIAAAVWWWVFDRFASGTDDPFTV